MRESHLVSIIVRTKDRPKLLERALQSIAAQTCRPIEVVLVNDGGCELDIDVLKTILRDVPLNYVRLEENVGRAHAGNVGIENSKGGYVCFLDDDDIYHKDAIRILRSSMDGGRPVVYGQVLLKFYDETGNPDVSKKDILFATSFSREILLYTNYIPFNALLFDRSLFSEIGRLDETLAICEDWDFLLNISDTHSFKYVPELVAEYSSFGASLGGGGRFDEQEIGRYEKKIRLKRLDAHSLSIISANIEFVRGKMSARYESERQESQRFIDKLLQENEQLRNRDMLFRIKKLLMNAFRQKGGNIQEAGHKREDRGMQRPVSLKMASPFGRVRKIQGGAICFSYSFSMRMLGYVKRGRTYLKTHGTKAFFQKALSTFYRLKKTPRDNRVLSGLLGLSLPDPHIYDEWLQNNAATFGELISQRQEMISLAETPLITIVIPVFNTNPAWLSSALESVCRQSYGNWQAIIVDDCSGNERTKSVIDEWQRKDRRFEVIVREINGGVSAACQGGLLAARGTFVLVLDHDDLLEPDALYHIAGRMIERPDVDVIYSDEIMVDENENILNIVFRPGFSLDYLLSHPYIVHITAYRRDLALAVGGYDARYEVSQDYDLLLKLASVTSRFEHISRPLYRWRIHPASTGHQKQDKVMGLSRRALGDYLSRMGDRESIVTDGLSFNFFRVRRKVRPATVDIVIPTKDRKDLLEKCIDSLIAKTVLPDGVGFRIIIADNGSEERNTIAYLGHLRQTGATIVDCSGPFNFSAINNKAASCGKGDVILFLNNDVEIIEAEWLEAMLEQAQRPDVGATGAKLLYTDGIIQHAGVLIGMDGVAAHSHHFFPEFRNGHIEGGHIGALLCVRDCMAVTAACMMVRRTVFEKVGGFDENFAVGFGDTDLCLRIYTGGYKVIWTPYARLIHHESASRGKTSLEAHMADTTLMRLKWEEIIRRGDPYYNPNLSLRSNNFSPR